MSFVCNNCGQKYSYKVDFCDCGNNTFSQTNDYLDEIYNDYDEQSEFNEIQEDENVENKKDNLAKNLFIISLIVMICSICFSVFLIIKAFAYRGETLSKNIENNEKIIDIPDIDSYWIDEVVKKTNSVMVQKTTEKSQKTTKNTNSVQKKKQNASNNKNKKDSKNKTKDTVQNDVVKQNKIDEIKNDTESSSETKKDTISAQEFSEYKNDLRNRLFSFFPILSVQGKGSAKIGFSISQEGKLLNRRFVSLSDNKSLNDALYHMLMRTPEYKQPPSFYDGKEIIMQMDFDNGKYSFSFIN